MSNIFYNVGNYQSYIILGLLIAIFIALITLIVAIILNFRGPRNNEPVEAVTNQSVEDIIGSLMPDLDIDKKNIQKIANQINREMQPGSINQFEREQEEKAIISYQELVKNIEHQHQQLDNVVKVQLPETPAPVLPINDISNDIKVNPDAVDTAKDYLQSLRNLKSNLK